MTLTCPRTDAPAMLSGLDRLNRNAAQMDREPRTEKSSGEPLHGDFSRSWSALLGRGRRSIRWEAPLCYGEFCADAAVAWARRMARESCRTVDVSMSNAGETRPAVTPGETRSPFQKKGQQKTQAKREDRDTQGEGPQTVTLPNRSPPPEHSPGAGSNRRTNQSRREPLKTFAWWTSVGGPAMGHHAGSVLCGQRSSKSNGRKTSAAGYGAHHASESRGQSQHLGNFTDTNVKKKPHLNVRSAKGMEIVKR